MFKKATLTLGIFTTCFLLWFAVYNYRQAGPIAEENLRGLALSLSAAIENLAVHDRSLAGLARFHTDDIAYFAIVDGKGTYRFHSNQDLVGTKAQADGPGAPPGGRSESRVTLGTGEQAYLFTSPLHLYGETLLLHLTLHTYRADAVVRSAKLNMAILLGLLAVGWLLSAGLFRYARREERHRLELARKESLAKLGELGALMAHEIRNPLAGIKGFAQVIAKTPTEERNRAFAGNIVAEAVRLENLVNELLAYASSDNCDKSSVDLAELFEHTASLLAPEASAHAIEISRRCPEGLHCLGNRDRLEQALLNLGKNALQAMPEGGTLEMAALRAGSNAVISVKDSGEGIAGTDLPLVFDPFFTTKARGTGLGLALCRKIADEHDGTIEVTSKINQGTTVTLTVPCP